MNRDPHTEKLRLQAHRLVDALARQSYPAKRLEVAIRAMSAASNYKAGRQIRPPHERS